MENGTYLALCRAYGSKRKMIVFNDQARIYTPQGVFIHVILSREIEDQYYKLERQTKANKLYNLAWMVRGEIKEIVAQNVSYAVCAWMKKQLASQYSEGLLLPIPSELS